MNSVNVLLLISTILPSQSALRESPRERAGVGADIAGAGESGTSRLREWAVLVRNSAGAVPRRALLQIRLNTPRRENRRNGTGFYSECVQIRADCTPYKQPSERSRDVKVFSFPRDYDEKKNSAEISSLQWSVWPWVTAFLLLLISVFITLIILFILTLHKLRKYGKSPEKQKTLKTPSQVKILTLHKMQMEPELLKEIRPETHAGLAAALNDSSDEENTTDDSMEEVQTEELHETQSLCEPKETPAAAPTAARGEMDSITHSLPNFAKETEDKDQNSVTQNALQLALIQRSKSQNISMPNLAVERTPRTTMTVRSVDFLIDFTG
ncbi:uncharacterized protein LOC127181414 isoform X1 [Labeo rohita]|uniref:uncharacterized protein LOC127181414 isoform X1 n=1 Tax=Labeo rohita TaxID=84645 RepID=UPI0021E2F1C1|nr:uncharacterized protein LOC127181414 isoform X1 [Labeo rohita]